MKDSRDDLHPKWFIWGQQPISCRLVRVARHVGALASTGVQPVGLLARRWRTRRIFLAPVAMAPVSTLPPNFLFLNENFQRFWRQIFQIVKIRFRWIRISDEFLPSCASRTVLKILEMISSMTDHVHAVAMVTVDVSFSPFLSVFSASLFRLANVSSCSRSCLIRTLHGTHAAWDTRTTWNTCRCCSPGDRNQLETQTNGSPLIYLSST